MRPTFDPSRKKLSMKEAETILRSWGGDVRRNGCTEIVWSHPLMPHPVTTNATRRETSDVLTSWLRQLNETRAYLRAAFELEEAS